MALQKCMQFGTRRASSAASGTDADGRCRVRFAQRCCRCKTVHTGGNIRAVKGVAGAYGIDDADRKGRGMDALAAAVIDRALRAASRLYFRAI